MILEYINSIINLFIADPVAQTSGFIGMICVWIAFLHKDDYKTIKMLFIASFFWSIHFYMLESYAGLVAVIISAVRLYLSMKYKKNTKVFSFVIALIIVTGIIVYDGHYSLLPIIGSFIGAYSFFFFSGIPLRIGCLALSIIWLIYNIYVGSIGGVINELVVEILIIVTIYKYVGINGHKLHFMSKIHSVLHPYAHVDYGRYTIVKDKNKISTRYNLREKLRNFFSNIIRKIKEAFTR